MIIEKIKKIESYQINTIIAWITRFFTMFISLFIVRINMQYLDSSQYALLAFYTSLGGWISILDFGIGTSFQNYISEKRVNGEDYTPVISKVFFIVFISIFLNIIIIIILSKVTSLYLLKRYSQEGNLFIVSLVMLFIIYLINVLGIINKLFFAEQQSWKTNIFTLIATIFGVGTFFNIKDYVVGNRIVFLYLALNLPNVLMMLYLIVKRINIRYFRFDKKIFLEIVRHGKKFFVFAILANTVLSIDYIIMIKFISSKEIIQYNLITRIYMVIFMLYNSFIQVFWSTASEKIRKREFRWVNKVLARNTMIFFFGITVTCISLILLKDFIFVKIFDAKDVIVENKLIILIGSYFIIRIWTDTFSMLLSSVNRLNRMLIFVFLQAIITPIAEVYFVKKFGVYGSVYGLMTGFLLTVTWFMPYEYIKMWKKR